MRFRTHRCDPVSDNRPDLRAPEEEHRLGSVKKVDSQSMIHLTEKPIELVVRNAHETRWPYASPQTRRRTVREIVGAD